MACLNSIILLLICVLLYFTSRILDIVVLHYLFMNMFAKRLVQYSSGLGDRLYVGVVLRYRISAKAPFMPGRGVDRGGDSTVESYVILPPYNRPSRTFVYIRQVEFRPLLSQGNVPFHNYCTFDYNIG